MHEHDHPSYDPLRRQIEALICECDELRRQLASEPLKAGMVIGLSEARADGYREAIADIAERTGCKTRPDEVSSLHELRDALALELSGRIASARRDAIAAAAEKVERDLQKWRDRSRHYENMARKMANACDDAAKALGLIYNANHNGYLRVAQEVSKECQRRAQQRHRDHEAANG